MKKLLLLLIICYPILCIAQTKGVTKYEVVSKSKNNDGMISHLNIYVSKMADIKQANAELVKLYKKPGLKYLQILYYDNKNVAKTYERKLFDKGTTDAEIDRMSQHVIGKFEYLATNNSESLHIGKEADTY
ncbi:hypothetical protein SAMN05192574_105365 [Mucilaginibacter gossypiicola]|uniref:Uncharacterized protein n=1 Tax=Mucilaginibacter gossypiicola TaxID=551995 RepID=A0A1H8M360_9SPHI|nr:hypothetical protein [Mucilaginibacter gossypiicola]SEO11711.1 hypothetical protein SAMN05192574_105365 [Mucilaginibacter gossypiicola]